MTIRKALIWSALMHIAAVAVMWFGVPTPSFESTEQVVIIAVDIADFSETTERKAPRAKPKPPEPVEETPPEPPPPPKEPDLAMIPPPPMPEPVPETPEPAPAPAEAAEDEPKALLPARPRPKPTPPKPKDDFVDNMLKTIDVLERAEPAKPPPPKTAESDDFLDDLAILLDDTEPPPEEQTQEAPVLADRLTASLKEAVKRQLRPCWIVPVGARNAEELYVTLRLQLRRDGSVIRVDVVDRGRQRSDTFFRAAADSARRAVMNPRCTPFKLPADRYDDWKDMTLTFNPREAVGR